MTSPTTPGLADPPARPAAPAAVQPLVHGLGDTLQLWLVDLDAYAAQDSLEGLTPDERQRAERMAFAHLSRRSGASRHVLRRLLGDALGRSPAQLPLVADRFGKPRLADDAALHFSLSHREQWALVGLQHGAALGVDIELMGAIAELDALAEACFSEAERAAWGELEPGERQRYFFTCWTRKEACVKALGVGLSAPLPAIDVGGGQQPHTLRLALGPGGIKVAVRSLAFAGGTQLPDGLVAACAWADAVSVERAHAAWG